MRGGRLLLVVGVIIILGAIGVGALLVVRGTLSARSAPEIVEEPTPMPPTPVPMVEIVVAVQTIPRGMELVSEDNVATTQEWPKHEVPDGAITSVDDVYGSVARVEIPRGKPILEGMLIETLGGVAAAVGSDAALQIPEGKVAYALPVSQYSSLAWSLQPGDHVDVLLSLLMVDLDEEFQTISPNSASCVSPSGEDGCSGVSTMGRLEVLPNAWVVNVTPSEPQRPRLVTQLTVQDAVVLQIGDWPSPEDVAAADEEEVDPGAATEEEPIPDSGEDLAEPTPIPVASRVEPLTVAVTRQDAMVLDYAQVAGARINLVLRPVGDAVAARTEAVTVEYVLERFGIELPPKLPYGITPPLTGVGKPSP